MSRRDQATLALLGFFCFVALTIELYFLVAHGSLVAAAAHNPLAWLLSFYGPSDSAYFASPSPLALALEGLNVVVTTPLVALLALGVVRRRAWRWPLQLGLQRLRDLLGRPLLPGRAASRAWPAWRHRR